MDKNKIKSGRDRFEEWLSNYLYTILFGVLAAAIIASIVIGVVYYAHFNNHQIASETDAWGQLGDYFGGTLNPIFGFLSVFALLAALVIQSKELKVSSEELKNSADALKAQNNAIEHQNFEQTFFSWLKTYRELLESVEDNIQVNSNEHMDIHGRKVLKEWWGTQMQWDRLYRILHQTGGFGEHRKQASFTAEDHTKFKNIIMREWDALYIGYQYQLDSLYRVLYRLIVWIDTQPSEKLTKERKWFYISIIRAQLSWIEMVYLFMNGLTDRGVKFKPLIEKYALFDNLTVDHDPAIKYLKENSHEDETYIQSAFNSEIARQLN